MGHMNLLIHNLTKVFPILLAGLVSQNLFADDSDKLDLIRSAKAAPVKPQPMPKRCTVRGDLFIVSNSQLMGEPNQGPHGTKVAGNGKVYHIKDEASGNVLRLKFEKMPKINWQGETYQAFGIVQGGDMIIRSDGVDSLHKLGTKKSKLPACNFSQTRASKAEENGVEFISGIWSDS
jgi:hypothetical protein